MLESWITPKAQKGAESGIAGRGLVALEPIAKGEVVAVKGGHIATTAALRALPERLQNSDVQITDDLHLVALTDDEYEPVMLFINHSCEPNVGFGGNIVLVAMRDIAAREELTTDYALFDDYQGSMDCNCGRSMCRRRIGGDDWRRPDLQERYRGYFSWYLERRILDQSDGVESPADPGPAPLPGTAGFDLSQVYVHLGLGARAETLPDFTWSEEYLRHYETGHEADGVEGRLVMIGPEETTWTSWERHPAGDEVVVALSGHQTLIQEIDGEHHRIDLRPGQAAINPRGVWHTADVHAPGSALFITPGRGTEHRPR